MSDAATISRVLLLDLVNDADLIAAYRDWHRPGGPPAAVTRSIREAGIVEMTIWQAGDRLVMLIETTADYDPAAKAQRDAKDSEVRGWETMMDRFQKRLPFASEGTKWVAAERIYALSEQPDR